MKYFLTLSLTAFSIGLLAQDKEKVTELTYCGQTFDVPTKCSANSQYELTCDNFTIQWLYMNEQILTVMPQQFIGQLESKLTTVKKEQIKCKSLGTELTAYKLTYKDGKREKYKIVAYGNVGGQPVLVNVGLDVEPTDNEKLPKELRQIIELSE